MLLVELLLSQLYRQHSVEIWEGSFQKGTKPNALVSDRQIRSKSQHAPQNMHSSPTLFLPSSDEICILNKTPIFKSNERVHRQNPNNLDVNTFLPKEGKEFKSRKTGSYSTNGQFTKSWVSSFVIGKLGKKCFKTMYWAHTDLLQPLHY